MTLSTNVYVLDPVNPAEVFRFCQQMLTQYDDERRAPEQQRSTNQACGWSGMKGSTSLSNQIGQNLPAILDITYCPDGPLRTTEEATRHDDECDDGCTGMYHDRACFLDIDFDTAYGAKFEGGMGCGDLHAALVAELGRWLDERGARWEWRNEFTGEVHGGPDRYERLIDLCSGGFEATAWFQASVLPALGRAFR